MDMLIVFVAFFILKSLDLKHDSGSPGSPLPLIDQLPGWLPLSEPRYRLTQRLLRKNSQFSSEALTGCIEPHKAGVGTLWPNLNRLIRLVPCGKGDFTFTVIRLARGSRHGHGGPAHP